MKVLNLIRAAALLGAMGIVISARADEERHARFHQAIENCQKSEYNTAEVVFPAHVPGQRPEFTPEQKALFQACVAAGIIPPPHDRRVPASK